MKCVKIQLVLFFCLCCMKMLWAQPQNGYQFAHLDFTQGLSHNQVNCIYKDRKGFMWFGTMSGLNRYDGYVFKTYRHTEKDSTTLSDDYISWIAEGPFGKLWIQTRTGYNIYDPETEKFNRQVGNYLAKMGLPQGDFYNIIKDEKGYWFIYRDKGIYYCEINKTPVAVKQPSANNNAQNNITDVKIDSKGNLWILYVNALIEKADAASKKITYQTNALQQKLGKVSILYKLYVDADDDLWVYAGGEFNGVYQVNIKNGKLVQIARDEGIAVLNNNIVNGLVNGDKNHLWIATDHGGLNILDKTNMTVNVLLNKTGDDKSLAQNSLTAIFKDDLGIIWVGTYKQGISYYYEGIVKFPLYKHQESNASSLPYDDVNRFVEDRNGNIWIGTNGGGLIYFDRSNNSFKQFKHNPANNNSLTNDVIVSLCIDHQNILWIGTYYGGLDSYDGKTFKHHRHNDADSTSLADDRVWEIYEDKSRNLWIGTFEAGLDRYDRNTNTFYHYKPNAPNSVHTGYISSITEDNAGNLWIGTYYGINVMDRKTGVFTELLAANTRLGNDNVITIFNDSRGAIWAGTRDGLSIYNPQSKNFQSFRKEDGLPDNAILNIVEDNAHNLWISTPNGISRINYKGSAKQDFSISCVNYDKLDGLQAKEFNENAALKTNAGEIIFGGANGFNLFNPANIKNNTNPPRVILTGLQVFNENVEAGDNINKHIVLTKAIAETDVITLSYDDNIFSLEFAALSYINTEKNKYAYKLEGFNDNWLFTNGSARKVTYTNLDPGEYTFYVKASNNDGVWNEKGIAVKIIVLPPFWQTPAAYALYLLAATALLYLARRIVIQRAKMRFALEQERKEAQRMHELDMMKIRFLTNVSHEFRTPLSLILAPLDKMMKVSPEPVQKLQYQLIYRNARRLLNLVNQLLDFRKMEVQELKLNTTEGDIAKFIKDISCSFSDIAEKKHIEFSYTAVLGRLYTTFDHDKLERILFNLLSNAFKFTTENGMVSVELLATKSTAETLLEIKVRDTGIGIPADKQEKIFERFFQHDIPGTMVNQGSGIGLAITKEFVNLHNGTISVESTEYKGSCFTVLLPVKEIEMAAAETEEDAGMQEPVIFSGTETEEQLAETGERVATSGKKKHTVLLVEDNEDFLFYLKDNLREFYNIAEAVNGKDGWQKTLAAHPDIVVSDISMPLMDGIELCKKIKQDQRTTHIPVVLLTALTGEEQQLRSLETGAADYMTKPFNFEILVSRIKNLLSQQQSLRQTLTRQVEVKATNIEVDSPDEKFVQDALAITEKNISNADFSVDELSRNLLLSRATVYKRLFVLTGKTPAEFIRSVRLQRAAQLLEKTQMTVAEVAYETGFNNPKYFSKYFKAQFSMLPSAYQALAKKAASDIAREN
jgi:signal transduction histidine kinase/ligand-binding sensor domain-containing protein/DNA-binding response OmpR family regulator